MATKALKVRAVELARQSDLLRTDFKARSFWTSMKKRHGFPLRKYTDIYQKFPAEFEEKLDGFHRYVLRYHLKQSCQLGQVRNVNQTLL